MSIIKFDISEKDDILQKIYGAGFHYESEIRGCGQATVRAVMDYFQVDTEIFKAVSTCYGGICGNGTGPCGGYIAAAILLSYFFGRDIDNQHLSGSNFRDRQMINEIRQRYHTTFGGETCKEVQNHMFGRCFDINDPQDKKIFEENGAHVDKCPHVVGIAARWIAEMLIDNLDLLKHE